MRRKRWESGSESIFVGGDGGTEGGNVVEIERVWRVGEEELEG